MPRRIRWAAAVEVGDAALDGGDDPEQGGAIELGRRTGGTHGELNICAVCGRWQGTESGQPRP